MFNDIKNIKNLAPLFPELRRVKGRAALTLNLSGKLNNIILSGNMLFSDLKIRAPVLKSVAMIPQLLVTISDKHVEDWRTVWFDGGDAQ